MADLEKVITGLECCSVKQSCSECPWKGIDCNDRLHLAALELLKEQQETLVSFQSTINKLTKALAEQSEQKFFVDFDGKITPLPKQPQWISVKDRMPAETHSMFFKLYGTPKWRDAMWREESDHVLVAITFEDGSRFVTSGYTQDGKWSTGISKILQYTVTHWMPLPEPPEVEQDG